jgi:hypothetical protein
VADDCAFADLRRLSDALSALETRALRAAAHRSIVQLVTKLGEHARTFACGSGGEICEGIARGFASDR